MKLPYNWEPEAHQLPILQNPSRFKVLVWHRKGHKTTLAINELLRWAFAMKGTYWYVAPFYSQAKKIVWDDPEMLARYCPPEIWNKRNNSELKLVFPNGSVLYVLGADKPDSLRGPNPRGVVFDEYGDMKSDVWSAIVQPIMTANPKAWTWFVGTPKGRNDFYKKYILASNGENKNWFASRLKASESGIIPKEGLEEAKLTTTQAFFQQEYETEFLESAASFFRRTRENLYHVDGDEYKSTHQYQLGVDLAKYQDWTVITPFDLVSFKVLPQDRFNQVDWNLQKARIEVAWRKFNKAILNVDSTGVGDPIAEDLKRMGMDVMDDGFKFTEKSKRQLLDNLAILVESNKISLPDDEELLTELEAFQYQMVTTAGGKQKITVETTAPHDDRVMSLALATWKVKEGVEAIGESEEFVPFVY